MSNNFAWKPMTPTVIELRERYRVTKPEACTARLKLITEYYKEHLGEPGLVIKSESFKYLCEKMPVVIRDKEIVCGNVAIPYRGAGFYPEGSGLDAVGNEIRRGDFRKRELEPYILSDENEKIILECQDFWHHHSNAKRVDAACPDGLEAILGHGVDRFRGKGRNMHGGPVGHFCTNYDKMLTKGFAAVRDEAKEKMAAMEGKIFGDEMDKYQFYRAVVAVCDGAIIYAERVAQAVLEEAERTANSERKAELLEMAKNYNHMFKNPVDTYFEAVQALYLYQILLTLDGNLHGLSWGRVDQYLGKYYEKDIAAGILTEERAQEIMDQFFLRVQELNKIFPAGASKSSGGYTSGQLMTIGGIKKDGTDATNAVTYMMLQSSARLQLHDPTMALRVHKNTPKELLRMAIRCNERVGGIPTFESDDVIMDIFRAQGRDEDSVRNYCLIGCVEPGGCGDEWPAPGGSGSEAYFNLPNVMLLTLNNGVNPCLNIPDNAPGKVTGLQLGYLRDYKTFEEFKEAYKKQLKFFVDWHVTMTNSFEYASRDVVPVPIASCMMDGCMEKGMDVMRGGAKYNTAGIAGVGVGTTGQSFNVIEELVYKQKVCTADELMNAILADWDGYDDLREKALAVTHFGNGEPEYDKNAAWVAQAWCDAVNSCTGPRGQFKAGLWSVARHVADGELTNATPDGRKFGDPLSDGIGPVQGTDKQGPTALLRSIAAINQKDCTNGTLLNMRFHPTAITNEDDLDKLGMLIQSYFAMGGMHVQFNFVSAETMKAAKVDPEKHKDLVVRVAGFSAYFTELHDGLQNEIIHRTEIQNV